MKHEVVEKNIGLMIVLIIVAISFGTLVELVPLMFGKQVSRSANPLQGSSRCPHWNWRAVTSTFAKVAITVIRR